jgi:tetratricopeptide (TPR) repeat protein
VPVWHKGTAKWVKEGKLVLLGVTQEQHPDRCRLLAQWQGLGWPILHDPINVLGPSAVPVLVAIDEHGIVRSTRPRLDTFETDFLGKSFPDEARGGGPPRRLTPDVPSGRAGPDFEALRRRAEKEGRSTAWRDLGDALALWGGEERVSAALDAYTRAAKLAPKDAATQFRLGVCYRRRYESGQRQAGDFQAAVDRWSRALDLDPNQYIWRRRIQQYGPRLDKPYAFYDWVSVAEKEITARGEKPVALRVRPGGAEMAQPLKAFPAKAPPARPPDPEGKVRRDNKGLIRAEVTVVPPHARPGQAVRIHVVLRPDARHKAHWNNEAEPLRLWLGPPEGWQVAQRLLVGPRVKKAVTEEERALDFEVKAPAGARGKARLSAYALYHVCDDDGGQCRFLRLDIPIEVPVRDE